MEPHLTDDGIRLLMLDAIEPMDPEVEAGMLAKIEAMLDAREAERAAEAQQAAGAEPMIRDEPVVEPETAPEPPAPAQPIPLPRPKIPRALVIAPFAAVGLLMAAMALVALGWLLFRGGGPARPGQETPPSELPLEAGRDEEGRKR